MLKFNVKITLTNISKDYFFNYLLHFFSNCVLIVWQVNIFFFFFNSKYQILSINFSYFIDLFHISCVDCWSYGWHIAVSRFKFQFVWNQLSTFKVEGVKCKLGTKIENLRKYINIIMPSVKCNPLKRLWLLCGNKNDISRVMHINIIIHVTVKNKWFLI